jgi:uncharacterized RDD family membrane protein YckC
MTAAERWYLELGERRVELGNGELVIGRDPGCELVLDDATVSRSHALLSVDAERVTLQDLESSNGSFVNGQRLHGERELTAGDRLRLGRIRLYLARGVLSADVRVSRRFCPACGAVVAVGTERCLRCGDDLAADRPMSRSEAVAMSEVMPVGEALARPAAGLQSTRPPFPSPWAPVAPPRGDDTPPAVPLPSAGEPVEVGEETVSAPRPAAAVVEATDEALRQTAPGGADLPQVTPALPAVEADDAAARRRDAPLFLPAAGFLPRLGAVAVDLLWLTGLGVVVAWLLTAGGVAQLPARAAAAAVAAVAWAAVALAGWSRSGTTPGKRLFRLYVCDLDGRPGVGPRRARWRLLGCLLSVLTGGLGFLRAGLAADRRALHDHLAGTYVARRG